MYNVLRRIWRNDNMINLITGSFADYWKPTVFRIVSFFFYQGEDLYQFQGDILLTRDQYMSIFNGTTLFSAKEGVNWPNGIIPYDFRRDFSESKRKKVLKAMNTFHRHTCIKFRKKNRSDRYYIKIGAHNSLCQSHVGRVSQYRYRKYWINGQILSLPDKCLNHRT